MDALHEHVGGDQHFAVGVGEYGAVVAYAVFRGIVLWFYVFREMVDETKFSKFGNVHLWVMGIGC